GDSPASANRELFGDFEEALPSSSPPPFALDWQPQGSSTKLVVSGLPEGARADFFPLPAPGSEIGHTLLDSNNPGTLEIPALPPFRGVLV
ncbi:MAG: hypothetical protein N2322_00675, partial [Terrimicrobiaceae bacterium]|nr:hypothetical protein [Terrimicrobiaceae bacterium]